MNDLERVGMVCRSFRQWLGVSVREVGKATGYTYQNVLKFEKGLNNNAIILSWYLNQGLTLEDIEQGVIFSD